MKPWWIRPVYFASHSLTSIPINGITGLLRHQYGKFFFIWVLVINIEVCTTLFYSWIENLFYVAFSKDFVSRKTKIVLGFLPRIHHWLSGVFCLSLDVGITLWIPTYLNSSIGIRACSYASDCWVDTFFSSVSPVKILFSRQIKQIF